MKESWTHQHLHSLCEIIQWFYSRNKCLYWKIKICLWFPFFSSSPLSPQAYILTYKYTGTYIYVNKVDIKVTSGFSLFMFKCTHVYYLYVVKCNNKFPHSISGFYYKWQWDQQYCNYFKNTENKCIEVLCYSTCMSTFNVPAKNKLNWKINKMNLNLHSYTPNFPSEENHSGLHL